MEATPDVEHEIKQLSVHGGSWMNDDTTEDTNDSWNYHNNNNNNNNKT